MRQLFEALPGQFVSSLSYEYPAGWQVPAHAHESDQLIYGVSGIMQVTAANALWVVPPQFALWIPGNTVHAIRMPGAVSMRTLYLRRGLVAKIGCGAMGVPPLLRELILETTRIGQLTRKQADRAFCSVLVTQIERAPPLPTQLTMPRDPRARHIAEWTLANPEAAVTLAPQCRRAGVSVRTLQRIFRREVGVEFEAWRRQARILKAVELLVSGCTIKEVSHAVGYRQPTTFVGMFRRSLGMTPKAWAIRFAQPSTSN